MRRQIYNLLGKSRVESDGKNGIKAKSITLTPQELEKQTWPANIAIATDFIPIKHRAWQDIQVDTNPANEPILQVLPLVANNPNYPEGINTFLTGTNSRAIKEATIGLNNTDKMWWFLKNYRNSRRKLFQDLEAEQ